MALLVGRRAWASLAAMSACTRTPLLNTTVPLRAQGRFYREPSPCLTFIPGRDKRPCFNMENLIIIRASNCHYKMIRSFLYTHYWPREPSISALWFPLCSKYLEVLTEKYASTGVRYIAFEKLKRTNELKMVGVMICNKIIPWAADELEEWALCTDSVPEMTHMRFKAKMIREANLYDVYNVPYVYEIEVLATAEEVMGLGVGTELVRAALADARDQRLPVTALVATSYYAARICRKIGMDRAWSFNYADMLDPKGKPLFFPRKPHFTVDVFAQKFKPD